MKETLPICILKFSPQKDIVYGSTIFPTLNKAKEVIFIRKLYYMYIIFQNIAYPYPNSTKKFPYSWTCVKKKVNQIISSSARQAIFLLNK